MLTQESLLLSRRTLSIRVIIRMLVSESFPPHLLAPVIAHNRALVRHHVKHGYRFEIDVIGIGHPPEGLPRLANDDWVTVTYRVDPRVCGPSVEDLIKLARDRAIMEQHCDEEASIIYMLAHSRFTSVGLYRLLNYTSMLLDRDERGNFCSDHHSKQASVGLLSTDLDGSDDLTPTIYCLAELNPLGPRNSMSLCPSIAVTTTTGDRDSLCPSSCLAEALLYHSESCLFDSILATPASLPRSLLASNHTADTGTCSVDLPVCPALSFTSSFHDHMSSRRRMLQLHTEKMDIPRLVLSVSEMAWHLAFVFAFTLIVSTPIHEHYTDALYFTYGLGFDCSDGSGTGLRRHR